MYENKNGHTLYMFTLDPAPKGMTPRGGGGVLGLSCAG